MKLRQAKECENCSSQFHCPTRSNGTQYSCSTTAWTKRRFCSHRCANVVSTPITGMARRGTCSQKTLIQLRTLAAARKGVKREPFTDEWRKNLSLAHIGIPFAHKGKKNPGKSGAKHWNWKGGATAERNKIGNSMEWSIWREQIFKRDGYRCLDCGTGGYVEAHHIIPVRSDKTKLFNTNNGITLCRPCHMKTFRKESEFASVYMTLATRAL